MKKRDFVGRKVSRLTVLPGKAGSHTDALGPEAVHIVERSNAAVSRGNPKACPNTAENAVL
jgi:hypothetical protein